MAYKKSAYEAAALYLSRRMRTEKEVRDHLKAKEYSEEEADEAVNELKTHRYIDDYEYARSFIEYGLARKHASKRILRELAEKGVEADTANFAYEDYVYENGLDEYGEAKEHGFKLYRNATEGKTFDDDTLEKVLARIARNLAGRGYSSGDIYKVLDDLRRMKAAEDTGDTYNTGDYE